MAIGLEDMETAKLEYDPKKWKGSKSERVPTLQELVDACMEIILEHNTWENSGDLWFFELGPNIHTEGEISKIGKISEWRATLEKGANRDEIVETNNFFGETPSEAVALLYLDINEHNQ